MSIENSRRKPGEDWVAIVQRNGTKEFSTAFAPNPVLDASVMNGPCVGVEVIASFFAATAGGMYDSLAFTNETIDGAKTYLEWEGKAFGKHFAGPSWEANDGSRVTGKAVANVPSPDADSIPWLLVNILTHDGSGVLSRATSIQRVNTKGGKAPGSGCDASHTGQELRVPYEADYLFYAPK